MSLQLRILLIITALLVGIVFVRSVRKSKMRIEDTLFWAFLCLLILILSIFPQIATWCSELFGFQAPVNFVFLFFIFVLIAKCFMLSRDVSHLQTKLKELTQRVAIDRLDQYERRYAPSEQHADDEAPRR